MVERGKSGGESDAVKLNMMIRLRQMKAWAGFPEEEIDLTEEFY